MSLDLSSLQLKDIKYLLAVYRLKSFREAADLCGVTQATISGQILKIERVLNTRLIERSSRTIEFTPVAERLIEQFIKINKEVKILSDMAFSAQANSASVQGIFRIGIIPTLTTFFSEKILPQLKLEYPDFEFEFVEVTTDHIRGEIEYANIDFAICAKHPLINDFSYTSIGKDELLLLMNKENSNVSKKTINSHSKDSNIFILDDGNCLRDHAMEVCSYSFPHHDDHLIDLRYAASSIETLTQIAEHNIGLCIIPSLALIGGVNDDIVTCRLDGAPTREILTVYDYLSHTKDLFKEFSLVLARIYQKAYSEIGLENYIQKEIINNELPEEELATIHNG